MDEIIQKILLKVKTKENDALILEKDTENKISNEKFLDIIKKDSDKKLVFIDGGSLEILKAPSFSVFFNRVYSTTYQKNKRIANSVVEFYTLITAEEKPSGLFFDTEYFFTKNKIDLPVISFDSYDKTIASYGSRAEISSIGNVIRRFAEISIVKKFDEEYIILDGSLEPKYTNEKEIMFSSFSGKKVFGFSKTCELLTRKGDSAAAYLNKIATKNTWYYHSGKVQTFETYFIKLNKTADYVFRLDAVDDSEIEEVVWLLSENSRDAIFLGYPYGLIEADRFARVSKKEQERLQIQFMLAFKKDSKKILSYLNSLNSHNILDRIG